jgi:hypothetical protein
MLSALIQHLQELQDEHGDLYCFTNGEHGAEETVSLTRDTVSVGDAENELDEEFINANFHLENDTQVLHIGGY